MLYDDRARRPIALLYPVALVLTPRDASKHRCVGVEPIAAHWAASLRPHRAPLLGNLVALRADVTADAMSARGGAAALEAVRQSALNPVPSLPIFRPEALEARHQEEEDEGLPEVTTSGWMLLGVLVSAVAVLLLVGFFGSVEVTSTALGSLRVQSGPRPVLAQTSGTVSRLQVGAGELVDAGEPIAELQAAELVAHQSRLSEQLSVLEHGQRRAEVVSGRLHERTLAALERKRRILLQRSKLKESSIARQQQREAQISALLDAGAASGTEALNARTALDAAKEELLLLRQQIAEVSIELLDRKDAYGTAALGRELSVLQTGAELGEAQALAALSVIDAPMKGRVESLLVSEGQVVPMGAIVARIVPEGDVTRAVVFAPSKEAAFLREDLLANLEFPSLPVSDFGRARARVVRVGSDVASAAEVAEVMEGPMAAVDALVRIELVIDEDATWQKMSPRLRSGARVTARLITRKRRLISLAFDFVKQWLPER